MNEALMMTGQLLADPSFAHSMEVAQNVSKGSGIAQLVIFVLTAWGLFNINKKLGEPNAWVSWIPVLNIYSYVRAAGKPNIWILWWILGFIALIIPGLVITVILYNSISKRTGRGIGTTLGFIFLGFIFFPLVGQQFQEGQNSVNADNTGNSMNPVVPVTASAAVVDSDVTAHQAQALVENVSSMTPETPVVISDSAVATTPATDTSTSSTDTGSSESTSSSQ